MTYRKQVIYPEYERISEHIRHLRDKKFDVVVIGSGYGGGISASRMARMGKTTCVLERGDELLPGQYPATFSQMNDQMQVHTDGHNRKRLGSATALFDFRMNEDVSALIGCGVGGTSLINANVSLEAHKGIFSKWWPKCFRENGDELARYYERARKHLGTNTYPERPDENSGTDDQENAYPELNKFSALDKAAEAFGAHAQKAPINVSFEQHTNWAGVKQEACTNCGDCCSGCNVGAKNTTLMNYLPDAYKHGAKIYNHATVLYIEKNDATDASHYPWLVHVRETRDNVKKAKTYCIKAKSVMLAAGTLGTAAIMQRSRKKGLPLSNMLGKNFSGNGDVLAFSYNAYWKDNDENTSFLLRSIDEERFVSVNAVGLGENRVEEKRAPGPCISGVIDLRDTDKMEDGLIIEEGVIPGGMASTLPLSFMMAAAQQANFTRYGAEQAVLRLQDITSIASAVKAGDSSLTNLAYKGAISRTQTFLVMSVDDACGELQLSDDDEIALIHWPGAGESHTMKRDNTLLARASDASQGQFIPYPLWQDAFGNKIVTVHPLGGCAMADSCADGVVNHKCQVYCGDENEPEAVYENFYICDGSVIPGALGVNPLLTISAVTERACDWIQGVYGIQEFDPYANLVGAAPGMKATSSVLTSTIEGDDEQIKTSLFERVSAVATVALSYWLAYRETRRRREARKLVEQEKETDLWANAISNSSKLFPFYSKEVSPGFSFSETMRGKVSACKPDALKNKGLQSVFRVSAHEGASHQKQNLILDLELKIDKIQKLLDDRENSPMEIHKGRVVCDVLTDGISRPLKIRGGKFYMLVPNYERVDTWNMIYEIHLDGHFLYCYKTLEQNEKSHWWKDLSTVDVEIYEGKNREGRLIALGRASLTLQDFIHQASTFKTPINLKGFWVNNLPALVRLRTKVEGWLGRFFIQKLMAELSTIVFNVYGGVLVSLQNNHAQRRKELAQLPAFSRALQAPAPKRYTIRTPDQKTIQLVRYQGGDANNSANGYPVIIAPGAGVTASSYASPSVQENLVEYLTWGPSHSEKAKPNCDVWLLDYRASYDSGSATTPFSIDDIAENDWQAAIDFVLSSTQAEKVQIVAHCIGAMSLLMGLLKGWIKKDQIQSIIVSQLSLHPVSNWLNNVKSDPDLAEAVEELPLIKEQGGVIDMNSKDTPFDKAVDLFCYQVPPPDGEKCESPVCRRINAVWGPAYLHEHLNEYTHLALGDWFKPINLRLFRQLTTIMSFGYVIDENGDNSYFVEGETIFKEKPDQQVPNLALPISFMAGAKNRIILPETSQRTFDWICAHNPGLATKGYYERTIFSDYGHMDCFIGKNSNRDIFPYIWQTLLSQASLIPDLESAATQTTSKMAETAPAEHEFENTPG